MQPEVATLLAVPQLLEVQKLPKGQLEHSEAKALVTNDKVQN